MAAVLPAKLVTAFQDRVPSLHWSGGVIVAHRRVALNAEKRRPVSPSAAEPNTLDAKLGHDIVGIVILGVAMHRQTGNRDRCSIQNARIDNPIPGDEALLRKIVFERAKARNKGHNVTGTI